MRKNNNFRLAVSLIVLWFAIGFSGEANAELFFSGYLEGASTHDSDVELNRPGGTFLTFSDVSWDDDSLTFFIAEWRETIFLRVNKMQNGMSS